MSAKEKELKLENNEYKIQILDLEDQLHNLKNEKKCQQSDTQELINTRLK